MRLQKRITTQRKRRTYRVSNRIKRDSIRPRLCIFRSLKHMYALIIDDRAGRTLVAASTVDKQLRQEVSKTGNKEAAAAVGRILAQRAIEAGITQVAFDRRSYRYHGRVAALADAARSSGLQF
jgi:large subunit ribosomal protein L18